MIITLCISSCSKTSLHKYSSFHMGTEVNLIIRGDSSSAAKASEKAFAEISRIEELFSPNRETSDIYKINKSTDECVSVSEETLHLIEKALKVCDETSGAFDITFASLNGLWNFKDKNFRPPSEAAVSEKLHLTGCSNIFVNRDKGCTGFQMPEVQIGAGGIAKGYALQQAMNTLLAEGIESALIDAGGDILAAGKNGRRPWTAGLRDPRGEGISAALSLYDGDCIATSGDYERFAMHEGKRWHHIIDPRTGFPAEGLISVTVISSDPVQADAWSTAFFVMGMDKSVEVLKSRDDLKAVLIDSSMRIKASGSLKERITLMDDVEIGWINACAEIPR